VKFLVTETVFCDLILVGGIHNSLFGQSVFLLLKTDDMNFTELG